MVKVKDLYEEPYALIVHVRFCEGRKPKQRRNKTRKEKRESLGAVTHTHTHTHTRHLQKRQKASQYFGEIRLLDRESRNLKRESSRRLKVLNLNLSATMIVAGIIVFVIIAIVAVKMIATAINSRSQKAMAEEETKGYTMVDSTELGEDGKPLQVPVPDGFSASQVPGETTVNGGFVIYEGEVDWSKIEDLSSYAEVETQELTDKEEDNVSTESINLDENTNSNTNSENNNTAENENSTSNIDEEGANTEGNRVNTSESEENNTTANKEAENNIESPDSNVVESSENKTKNTKIENTEETKEEQGETKNIEETTETEEIGEGEKQTQEGNIEEKETAEKELKEEASQEEQEKEKMNEEETLNNENAGIATMSGKENEGIATLAEGETPTTVFELQTSRNQYVWVPVKDVSRIYGVDSNGKLWGKLYSGVSKTATARSPQSSDWSESNGIMNIKDKTGYREPDVVAYLRNTNMNYRFDKDSELQNYRDGIEQYQMLSQEMEESFYRMIESVKKYGGYYIGRYETGDLGEEKAVVKKMNEELGGYINDTSITWYVMYEKCKNLEGEKENIETSMIWGSLWDETLQWLLESGAQIQDGEGGTREITESDINSNSSDWGNYTDATFEYRTTSGGTSTKNEGSGTRIPTGSAEYTKANNIYDLAGNVYDWTLEADSTYYRVSRGGYYGYDGSNEQAGIRYSNYPAYNNSYRRLLLRTLHKVMYVS